MSWRKEPKGTETVTIYRKEPGQIKKTPTPNITKTPNQKDTHPKDFQNQKDTHPKDYQYPTAQAYSYQACITHRNIEIAACWFRFPCQSR
ncbi:MAG: hypothetical protein ABW119_20495, partial [Candidatus Thiodiazotropha lotti]